MPKFQLRSLNKRGPGEIYIPLSTRTRCNANGIHCTNLRRNKLKIPTWPTSNRTNEMIDVNCPFYLLIMAICNQFRDSIMVDSYLMCGVIIIWTDKIFRGIYCNPLKNRPPSLAIVLPRPRACVWGRCHQLSHDPPDSKFHGTNMGIIRGRQDPGGPHVCPMNLATWVPSHRWYDGSLKLKYYFHQDQWAGKPNELKRTAMMQIKGLNCYLWKGRLIWIIRFDLVSHIYASWKKLSFLVLHISVRNPSISLIVSSYPAG